MMVMENSRGLVDARQVINALAERCWITARRKGFWEDADAIRKRMGTLEAQAQVVDMAISQKTMLVVSELGEFIEALRTGTILDPDEHCPECWHGEVELADAVIRILDMAHQLKFNLGKAIIAKMAFNQSRPSKHDKLF